MKLWNICLLLNKDTNGAATTDVILKSGDIVLLVNKKIDRIKEAM